MKNLLIACIAFCSLSAVQAQSSSTEKPQIAVLGTFHFGATTDVAAIVMDDVQGDKRQKELVELVNLLAKYKPTKILIEQEPSRQEKIQGQYDLYLKENAPLTVNEIQQIGFRLAKQLGHKQLYCVDYRMDMPMEKIVNVLQPLNKMQVFEDFVKDIQKFTASESEILKTATLTEYFARMNSEEQDQLTNRLYLYDMIVGFGEEAETVAADVSAEWLQRNIIIMKNIIQEAEPGDRILAIFGSSHRAILKDYLGNMDQVEYVEIGEFLK